MDDVEDGRLQSGGCNRAKRLLSRGRLDVRADTELLDTLGQVLGNVTTLRCQVTSNILLLTFMAMNFSTRYWVKTLITTSLSVWVSLSIKGRRRAWVWIRHLQASKRGRRGWMESRGGGGTCSSRSMSTCQPRVRNGTHSPLKLCRRNCSTSAAAPSQLDVW